MLKARGYVFQEFINTVNNIEYYEFIKKHLGKIYNINISCSLYDDEEKLKFIKKTDWKAENILYSVEDDEDDDLPF
ncbi:hypothetical protein [Empedobacter falsenii]|uniref:hypothetical protein n=1 Tax=Empedobacter falsenii TaxID=343874 RepID=UPI002578D536|nr:hypothetical protein [Empedobacter falsenii]